MTNPIQTREADIKRAVADWLTYQMNAGKLVYLRLNAGSFILTDKEGNYRRRVQGTPKGTADFIVIQPGKVQMYHLVEPKGSPFPVPRVTFLETKGSGGKQTPEQLEFEQKVKDMHCRYLVVRNVDEVIEALGKNLSE